MPQFEVSTPISFRWISSIGDHREPRKSPVASSQCEIRTQFPTIHLHGWMGGVRYDLSPDQLYKESGPDSSPAFPYSFCIAQPSNLN
jgi:hypothetical protein